MVDAHCEEGNALGNSHETMYLSQVQWANMVGMDIVKGQMMKMAGTRAELVVTCKITLKLKITEIKKAIATVITKASPTRLPALSPGPRTLNRLATADAR